MRSLSFPLALSLVASSIASAYAQTPPPTDAGVLLQQIEQNRPKPLPPVAPPRVAPPPPLQSLSGPTVTLKSFNLIGNTLLGPDRLLMSVAGFLNRPLTFAELQGAAIAIATTYRAAGWIVRAYLPQQDIEDGTLTIQIVEAAFGAVRVEGESFRVSQSHLKNIVEAAQRPGTPVNADAIDRALLLIDELPGMNATGQLSEGQNQAQTDLLLKISDGMLINGDVVVDNTGSRSTGSERLSTAINVNSPFQLGDLLTFNQIHTEGSDYERAAYTLPLGSKGWRGGVSASHLGYRVITPESAALDANGTSTSLGLEATYPIVRSRLQNLYLALNVDQKRFDNKSGDVTNTSYSSQGVSIGLNGNRFDEWGGGGSNSASLSLIRGKLDLANSPNAASDSVTVRTAGDYTKLRFSASRIQLLTTDMTLFAGLSGQMADKNLDSSEKFYLGGSGGVRAYPSSEGGGTEGYLMNLELRTRLPGNFNLTGFYDWGSVVVNKDSSFTGAPLLNNYSLKGMGLTLGTTTTYGLTVKATLARRIGDNPNPTASGNDQDGTLTESRFWLAMSMPFGYKPASNSMNQSAMRPPSVPFTTQVVAPVVEPAVATSSAPSAAALQPQAPSVAPAQALPGANPFMPSAPVATPAAAVQQTINAWLAAWQRADVAAYLDYYHPNFRDAKGITPAKWKQQRTQRLQQAGNIRIQVEAVSVQVNGDTASARFVQRYKANMYSDKTIKTLQLRRDGQAWRIVSETSSPVL